MELLRPAPRLAVVLATSLTIVLPCATAMTAADFPLVIGPLVTGSNANVQLTNITPRTITAWSLATTWVAADRPHREIKTVDGYLSEVTEALPGSSQRLDRLFPRQARAIALDPLPSDATVDVVAVVLDDRTAIGDEAVIASIFARRVKERDHFGAVVDAFTEVLSHQRGQDALDALGARLRVLGDCDPLSPCQAALDAVGAYHRDATLRSPDGLDYSLRTYAAFVSREYELAKSHSERRNRS
jgi:hypothetical protein